MRARSRIRALCAAALLAIASTGAQAQAVKLKFAIFSPDKEATFLSVFRPFAEAVNKDAAGTVEIELFPNGALGRSPVQQAQMVLDGVADLAWVIASYTPGRFQENEVFELPGVVADLREATLVFPRLVNSGKIRGYDDFFPIGLFGTAPYSLHSRSAINAISEMTKNRLCNDKSISAVSMQGFPRNELRSGRRSSGRANARTSGRPEVATAATAASQPVWLAASPTPPQVRNSRRKASRRS